MTVTSNSSNTSTWALAAAQLVAWGVIYYAFSLFVVPMESTMGWSRTATNGALSAGLLVSGLASWPIGIWIDHGHGRRVMTWGVVLATAMLVLWSQAHSLVTLFVAWIGLGVAMAATLYDPLFAVITRRFPDSFRKRITLVTLVGGFASTVFIPLTHSLVDSLGWRGALLVLAAINLAVCLPLNAVAIGRDTARMDHAGHEAATRQANAAAARRALRTPTFWALAVCFTAYYVTFAALTFHLVPLMTERSVSPAIIVATMAVIGPAQVLARVLWLTVGRNVPSSTMGVVITTAFPASVVILMLAGKSPVLLIVFATLYGGANGMMTILRGTILQDLLWTEGYGAVSGLLSMPSNIAKGIAPISAAAIWAIGRNYVPVEWAVLLVSLVSATAFVTAMRIAANAKRQSAETVTSS
ncbi:MAG TPA: MFS transporter [Paraburkholderia sp.]|jgi:predicted MFS family arabinose efflux permease